MNLNLKTMTDVWREKSTASRCCSVKRKRCLCAVMDVIDDVSDATLFDVTSVVTTLAARRHVDTSYLRMRSVINILLPIIFGAGVAGNALNAVLLTRRRASSYSGSSSTGRPTAFERSAMAGLVALSASDFAFCLVGFAEVLFVGSPPRSSWRSVARLYYDTYYVALMNLFLFSSTWLIALVSIERCLAVCYPFRAATLIRVRRTVAAHVVVFAVSGLLNVPLFLRSTIHSAVMCRDSGSVDVNSTAASVTLTATATAAATNDDDSSSCVMFYYSRPSTLSVTRPGLLYVHKVVWFALGTFLPLLLIVYSNVRLVREICGMKTQSPAVVSALATSSSRSASKASAGLDREKSSMVTLTMTLIAIGVLFLLLVCPSMAIQFWRFASYSSYGGNRGPPSSSTSAGRAEAIAIVLTNLTQAVKFSSNFLLYCVVSRSFRRTFGKLFGARRCTGRGGYPDEQRSNARRACDAALMDPPRADNDADASI